MIDMSSSSWNDWFLDVNLCGGDTTTWSTDKASSTNQAVVETDKEEAADVTTTIESRAATTTEEEETVSKPTIAAVTNNVTDTTRARNLSPPASPPAIEHVASVEVVQEEAQQPDAATADALTLPPTAAAASTKTTTSTPVRFRRFRKKASRVTGWSGALSKRKVGTMKGEEEKARDENIQTRVLVAEDATAASSSEFVPHEQKEEVLGGGSNDSDKLQMETDTSFSVLCCPAPSFDTEHSSTVFPSPQKICAWDCRPGTIGNLSSEQQEALAQLVQIMFQGEQPLRHCSAHEQEDRTRMILRFLRGADFDIKKTEELIRSHADFWHDFGMDDMNDFVEEENGIYFQCGRDVYQHPVMVARPCLHLAKDGDMNLKRILFSLAKCCQSDLAPHSDGTVVLYDCANVKAANFDLAFAKRLIAVLDPHFPERVVVIIIINNSWALQGMWALVSPLLDPVTRQKIIVCGHDYKTAKKWLGDDHPYLNQCEGSYNKKRKRRNSSDMAVELASGENGDSSKSQSVMTTMTPVVTTPTVSVGFDTQPCHPTEELQFVFSDPAMTGCPIVYASSAFLRSTGYTADAVIGNNFQLLEGPKTNGGTSLFVRQCIADMIKSSDNPCGGLSCTMLSYRRDESAFWNELHVAPVRLPVWCPTKMCWDWKTRLVVGIQLDCTQTLQQEQSAGGAGDPCEWDVDASCKRLHPIEPLPFQQESIVSHNNMPQSSNLDPAQAIALAVEQSLHRHVLGGTINPNLGDEALVRTLHSQLAKLRVTTASRQQSATEVKEAPTLE